MAVGQNQWYNFGVGAPPILVYFSGDWEVHWGGARKTGSYIYIYIYVYVYVYIYMHTRTCSDAHVVESSSLILNCASPKPMVLRNS